jgi:hypothetical protein
MRHPLREATPTTSNVHLLLAYVADVELDVDRLRKQGQFVRHEVRGALKRIRSLCHDAGQAADTPPALAEIDQAAHQVAEVLRDLHERPGYHPA